MLRQEIETLKLNSRLLSEAKDTSEVSNSESESGDMSDGEQVQMSIDMDSIKATAKIEELKRQHQQQIQAMAMQMDSELASMKEECDKKIEQARSEGGAYTAANTEDDEQKIELLLRTGTLTFQIRDLKRDVKRLTKELEVAQQREKDLS